MDTGKKNMTSAPDLTPFLSVCTPTYNRASYLKRVYASLCAQNFTNFEWLVIDDGSSDETPAVMADLIKQATFPVVYVRQENRGKHVAVNRAVERARGTLFIIIDSDDACAPGMFNTIESEWTSLDSKEGVAGLAFLTMSLNREIVGDRFPHERVRARMPNYYERFRIGGDKCDVHVTAVFRANLFPETPGEKFCPEALVWNRFSRAYDTVFINEAIKIVEYLPDGLSANIIKIRALSPRNTTVFYNELYELKISLSSRFRAAVNLLRFAFHGRLVREVLRQRPVFGLVVVLPAFLMYLRDKRTLAKQELAAQQDSVKKAAQC